MTNKEWLDHLAQNAPDELAAWFDAEHVETEERALDGDTDAQNEPYLFGMPLDEALGKLRQVDELQAQVDELKAERVKLRSQICKLEDDLVRTSDERDNWKANCEDWKKDCERYRSKFGKCIDYADAIHALMDEGLA